MPNNIGCHRTLVYPLRPLRRVLANRRVHTGVSGLRTAPRQRRFRAFYRKPGVILLTRRFRGAKKKLEHTSCVRARNLPLTEELVVVAYCNNNQPHQIFEASLFVLLELIGMSQEDPYRENRYYQSEKKFEVNCWCHCFILWVVNKFHRLLAWGTHSQRLKTYAFYVVPRTMGFLALFFHARCHERLKPVKG